MEADGRRKKGTTQLSTENLSLAGGMMLEEVKSGKVKEKCQECDIEIIK